MSKFVGIIVGGLEIVAGVVLTIASGGLGGAAGWALISAGVGTAIGGVGTLLSGSGGTSAVASGPSGGITTATRNPIAPWVIPYGRTVVGGNIIHINEFGDQNKYLDMVIVLAKCPCQSVDALLFDKQQVQLTAGGDSFSPTQQEILISNIARTQGVVRVSLSAPIPLLVPGDKIKIAGISNDDLALNGTWPIADVSVDFDTFTFISGGDDCSVDDEGTATTTWPDYGSNIHMEVLLGDHTETFPGMLNGTPIDGDPDNLLVAPFNPWTAEHRLLGTTAVFLRLRYDEKAFAGGLPQISFLMKGKNDIFDPRTETIGYTENAALCTADYLSNQTWGFKAAYGTEIPYPELIAAANICDEDVALAIEGTEKRYTVNGKFDLSVRRGEVLQNLLTACAGRITYQGGRFVIWPAAWRGSSPVQGPTLGSMTGPFRWKATVSSRDLYNGVKGTYVSPANNWQASDIPAYAQDETHGYESDANLARDNGERRWLDIQLPFTISAATAQRICKIELLRRRHQGTGTFRLNMSGYEIATMDVVSMDLPFFGWTDKLLEVLSHRFTLEKVNQGGEEVTLLGTEIDVQETDADIYDWSNTEELTPQGYKQPAMPDPTKPAPPAGLTLLSDSTTVVRTAAGLADAILVKWDAPVDAYVTNGGHMEIRYRAVIEETTGTVAATNGSDAVVGTGTTFIPAMAGGTLTINGVASEVLSVEDDTHLTLSAPFTGSTGSGSAFFLDYSRAWVGLPSVNPSVTEVTINGVVDGARYFVQIRSVNAGGVPSDWVSSSVKASGARRPMPWRPYGEFVFSAPFRTGPNLAQRDSFVDISGYPPINRLSPTLPAPVADAYAVVSAHGGNSLELGDFVGQIHGIDSDGLYSPASGLIRFAVTAAASRVTFAVNFPVGTVAAQVFIGRDSEHMISQPIILSPSSGNLNIDSISYFGGYGPPDTRAVSFHVEASRETHGGIFIAAVTAADDDTVTISIPSALTTDQLAGRVLSLMSKNGLPDTQVFGDLDITGNDTAGVLNVVNPGLAIDVGDLVMVRTKASAATETTITDDGWASPFASTGLEVDQDKDKRLVILRDPTGSALTGDTVTVLSNTSDTHTVTPFPRVPGLGTTYIIVEPGEIVDVKTKPFDNVIVPGTGDAPVVATVPAEQLAGYVALFRIRTRDEDGNDSIVDGDGLREMYIVPQPTAEAGAITYAD